MDQDSRFQNEKSFSDYLDEAGKLFEKNAVIASVGPLIQNKNRRPPASELIRRTILKPLKKKLLGKKYRPSAPVRETKDKVIRSGNIISITAWEQAGKFDEMLIVSEVDYDFCYRLTGHGFKIVRLNAHVLLQCAGEKPSFHVFPKFLNSYTDSRMYYNIRNAYIMAERYPERSKYYKRYLAKLFADYCINSFHILQHFRLWKKAQKDAVKICSEASKKHFFFSS